MPTSRRSAIPMRMRNRADAAGGAISVGAQPGVRSPRRLVRSKDFAEELAVTVIDCRSRAPVIAGLVCDLSARRDISGLAAGDGVEEHTSRFPACYGDVSWFPRRAASSIPLMREQRNAGRGSRIVESAPTRDCATSFA